MGTKYFLDTYSIIEIIKENKNFKKFLKTNNFTGMANLLETHYRISQDFDVKKANKILDKLKEIAIEIEIKDVKDASKFRLDNTKRKFSYIDCLGYSMALNRKMEFVTGDKEFKNFKNVEFVK